MVVSITSILTVALSLLTLVVLVILIVLWRQQKRIKSFTLGKDAVSLEDSIVNLISKVENIEKTINAHREALDIIDSRVKKSIRGYSLVKYNAYEDNGGEQSFATGLIDEYQNGYILSVISNRNHVGVYAKNVVKGVSDSPLTEEEKIALDKALKSI